jgi:hypothetical protein
LRSAFDGAHDCCAARYLDKVLAAGLSAVVGVPRDKYNRIPMVGPIVPQMASAI